MRDGEGPAIPVRREKASLDDGRDYDQDAVESESEKNLCSFSFIVYFVFSHLRAELCENVFECETIYYLKFLIN